MPIRPAYVLTLGAALLLAGPPPVAAQQSDCPVHVVRAGETLRIVAERYLGSRDRSSRIYSANKQAIGANPNLIEVGMRLRIPCAKPKPEVDATSGSEGAMTMDTADSATSPTAPAVAETVVVSPLMAPGSISGLKPLDDTSETPGAIELGGKDVPPEQPVVSDELLPAAKGIVVAQPVAVADAASAPVTASVAADAGAVPAATEDAQPAGEVTDALPAADPIMAKAEGDNRSEAANLAAADVAPVLSDVVDTTNSPEQPVEVFVLTGAPYLPFVDPDHPGGGMLSELVLAAFAETDGPPVRIGFVNDRPAHLDIILPRGGFAFSFPWLVPGCDAEALTPQQTALCERFVLSDSLYEHVTEFFALAESGFANARVPGDLAGARLCRPLGYPLDDLAVMELLPDRITLVRRRSPEACLRDLDDGRVDIASLDAALARAIVARQSPEQPVVVLEGLTRIERLHAVALSGDAAGRATLERLNAGLAILVETGLWFQIVSSHLSDDKGSG